MTSRELRSVINRYLILTVLSGMILGFLIPGYRPYTAIAAMAALVLALDVLDTMVDTFVREWRKRKSAAKDHRMIPDIVMTDWAIYEATRDDTQRQAVIDWCTNNGVDSMFLCVPGWIGRDETTNHVVYLTYTGEKDADGHPTFKTDEPLLVARTVQLDHKPDPFPAELMTVKIV